MRLKTLALAALTLGSAHAAQAEDLQRAVFAGGCFWCVESDFDAVEGVVSTISGYAGGTVENPTYRQVVAGGTGHREVVEVTYDADIIGFTELVDKFYRSVDVTDPDGQFCDRGFSYSTAVYAQTSEQLEIAAEVRDRLEPTIDGDIVTELVDGGTFYPAEEYHQNYYQKNPLRYRFYRSRCGRDNQVERIWGDRALTH
ncbi:peptide-methionine (S)-S-oxide reductase MsrA [Pontivivens insulae]|uniref:Peptide methionine sulfoxide reductase MsrA n=1 Tax=Pontivivens insulae TaxID=1639689 RepID=A0A2R8AAK6_9RHOB|nr:peptide-methionine (S)-S-oxide reductase MsrA [Pontivivens insulae]RED12998.1 peptide-methionine (S)-S-oxide reductase [Pontivivens insulae]SPF29090.1 Peptide methionine sulfoxide reductase MsrA [Pontivivens insulae]